MRAVGVVLWLATAAAAGSGGELDSAGWAGRIAAVRRAGGAGAAGLSVLEDGLRDPDWQVRLSAVHELSRFGGAGAGRIEGALTTEVCPLVRLAGAHALGAMGRPVEHSLTDAFARAAPRCRRWPGARGTAGADLRAVAGDGTCVFVRYRDPGPRICPEGSEVRAAGASIAQARPGVTPPAVAGAALCCAAGADPGPALARARRRSPASTEEEESAEYEPVFIGSWGADEAEPPRPARAPASEPAPSPPPPPTPPAEPSPESRVAERALALREARQRRPSPAPAPAPKPEPDGPEAREALLDLLWEAPETLPAVPGLPTRAGHAAAAARLNTAERTASEPAVLDGDAGRLGEPETLPPPSTPAARASARASAPADLAADAGMAAFHDALPGLISDLRHPEAARRSRAADELGALGPRGGPSERSAAVAALRAALADPSARVRASAALALGPVSAGADAAVPDLIRALEDPSADVRFCAAQGLGRIGTPAAAKAFRRHLRRAARSY